MRVRIVATYVTVAAVNATAGWLHLAGGEAALGWAFILATLAFLLLGWEADGRMAHARPPVADADDAAGDAEPPPALFDLPASEPPPAPVRRPQRARRGGIVRRLAWLTAVALVCAMELRLLAGLELAVSIGVAALIVAAGLGLPLLRLLAPPQRRTP